MVAARRQRRQVRAPAAETARRPCPNRSSAPRPLEGCVDDVAFMDLALDSSFARPDPERRHGLLFMMLRPRPRGPAFARSSATPAFLVGMIGLAAFAADCSSWRCRPARPPDRHDRRRLLLVCYALRRWSPAP